MRCVTAIPAAPTLGLTEQSICCDAAAKLFQKDGTLDEVDPEMAAIIRNEKKRQVRT